MHSDICHNYFMRVMLKTVLLVLAVLLVQACSVSRKAAVYEPAGEPTEGAYYYFIMGIEAKNSNDLKKALSYFERALKEDPHSTYLRIEVSRALLKTGRVDEALSTAEGLVEQGPGHIPSLTLLGELYSSKGEYKKAADMYEKVIKLDPSNVESYMLLSHLYSISREYGKSLKMLKTAIELDPDNSVLKYYMGRIYVELQDYDEAIKILEKAKKSGMRFLPVYFFLGLSYEQTGDFTRAIEIYEEAVSLDYHGAHNTYDSHLRDRLVNLYVDNKMTEKAVSQLKEIIRNAPEKIEPRMLIANIYSGSGEYQKAMDELRNVIDIDPENIKAVYALSGILMMLESYDDAIEQFMKLKKLLPGAAEVYLDLSFLYSQKRIILVPSVC